MRPSTLQLWEDWGILEDNLEQMRWLAYQGASLRVIAGAVGVDVRTLERWRLRDSKQFDERVYNALRRGREALVSDTGRYLMQWVQDKNVPIELRIQLAKELNLRHGKNILFPEADDEDDGEVVSSRRVFVVSELNE